MKRRVVVTGLGIVSSAGGNVAEFSDAVAAGRTCMSPIDDPRLGHLRARHAGLLKDFSPHRLPRWREVCRFDPFVHYAVAAAGEALDNAGITPSSLAYRMGLVFATCSGPMLSIEEHYGRIVKGDEAIDAGKLFAAKYYSGAKALCAVFGIRGPSTTVTTACSASAAAVGIAADLIRCGMIDVALVGGSDTFSPTTLAGFDGLKATSETYCAPFSRPAGLNLGEGSAFLVIEALTHARSRGAGIHAEFLGYGLSNDAYHCSAPDPSGRGQGLAMQRALLHSGLAADSIGYINAHGTGTAANDKAETRAVIRVFGDHASHLAMSSTKSMTGHCLGAAGSLELIASIVCAGKGVLPPTANFAGAREGCTLDYVPQPGRPWDGDRVFMSNSFAFGGNNASVIIRAGQAAAGSDDETQQAAPPVCITGLGVVSAAGLGVESLVKAVDSRSPLAAETAFGSVKARAACVAPFNERDIDRRLDLRNMDRPSRLATAAARCALAASDFSTRPRDLSELGFYLSLSEAPSGPEAEHITTLLGRDYQISQVQAFPYVVPNSVAGNMARSLGLQGHNTVFCTGPSDGLAGVGYAARAIEAAHAAACLSGAVDELSERIVADRLSAGLIGAAADRCPAEAAVVFMLESEQTARARGATVLARILGMAFTTDTEDMSGPDSDTAVLVYSVTRALESAAVRASDITRVCCDPADTRMIGALAGVLGGLEGKVVDVSRVVGAPQCCLPLLSLAYVLGKSTIETDRRNNYILCSFSSPQGVNSTLVVEITG